jgi:hypothetical protein
MYLSAIRSMICQPSSPSTRRRTCPRMVAIWVGRSASTMDIASRGSRSRLRAFRDRGDVRNASCPFSTAIHTGTLCGEPSGRKVARCAMLRPSASERTSSGSSVLAYHLLHRFVAVPLIGDRPRGVLIAVASLLDGGGGYHNGTRRSRRVSFHRAQGAAMPWVRGHYARSSRYRRTGRRAESRIAIIVLVVVVVILLIWFVSTH